MRRTQGGFTLLELVLAISLIAVTATIAVPGLQSLFVYGRRATEINNLHRDLLYARSEAVVRGMVVTLCTSKDGSRCTDNADWDDGWIVFVDGDGDLDRDAGERVLRVQSPFPGSDRLRGNRLVDDHIGWQRNGFLKGLHNGTITFSTVPDRQALRRCLVISRTGRIRAVDGTDSYCRE